MSKPRVLFLCTRNSVRSQMAEAFLKKYGGERFEAYSAGVNASQIHPFTIRVMNEAGIDISSQTSKSTSEYLGKLSFAYIVPVCREAEEACPSIFPGFAQIMPWRFEDPATFDGTEEEQLAKFREVRDQIEQKIISWLGEVE